jgi:phage baseplate assembly protein W
MKPQRFRAWQFVHPLFSSSDSEAGLQVSATGQIETVEEEAALRQSILLLLSTIPGERVMRPTYGCDLYRLAFSPNNDTTAGLAIHYVRQAISRWEPRVEIVRLDAARNDAQPDRLDIVLDYRAKGSRENQRLEYRFDLAGGTQ